MQLPRVKVHTPNWILRIWVIESKNKSGFNQKIGLKKIINKKVISRNMNNLEKLIFNISKKDSLISLDVIKNVIKYCNKIKIPKILIDIKKDVDNEIKRISK